MCTYLVNCFLFAENKFAVRATNLPNGISERDIHDLFKHYGQMSHVFISEDTSTCHVHYFKKIDVTNAISSLQNTLFYNEFEERHWNLQMIEHDCFFECEEYESHVSDFQHISSKTTVTGIHTCRLFHLGQLLHP